MVIFDIVIVIGFMVLNLLICYDVFYCCVRVLLVCLMILVGCCFVLNMIGYFCIVVWLIIEVVVLSDIK